MFFIKYFDINHSSQKVRWKNSTKKVFVFLCSVFSLLFFIVFLWAKSQLPQETPSPTESGVFSTRASPWYCTNRPLEILLPIFLSESHPAGFRTRFIGVWGATNKNSQEKWWIFRVWDGFMILYESIPLKKKHLLVLNTAFQLVPSDCALTNLLSHCDVSQHRKS